MKFSGIESFTNPVNDNSSEDIFELKGSVKKLEYIVQAMFECMLENGFTREDLNKQIAEAVRNPMKYRRPNYEALTVKCPKCGRNIQESRKTPLLGKCFFCGSDIVFYPYSELTSADEESGDDTVNDL